MTAARPFPWGTLDAISRDEVELARRFSRLLGAAAPIAEASRALEQLVGCSSVVRLNAIEPVAAPADPRSLAVSLIANDVVWIVEVEAALAVDVVARAMRKPTPDLGSVGALDSAAMTATAGAFATVVTKAMRRVRGDADVRVVAAGPAPSVLASSELADPSSAIYTLLFDADAYRARIVFSRRLAAAAPEPELGAAALARLGGLRLRVPVVSRLAWSTPRELKTLCVGDVWMPGASRDVASLVLAGPHADRGVVVALDGADRLVLGTVTEDLTMTDAAQDTLLESAFDAPIVVRVEVGSVELAAREWASLKPGDVVTLDRRVGAPVVLRAGGAELGRGELVDIDGEIGVRIASLASEAR